MNLDVMRAWIVADKTTIIAAFTSQIKARNFIKQHGHLWKSPKIYQIEVE